MSKIIYHMIAGNKRIKYFKLFILSYFFFFASLANGYQETSSIVFNKYVHDFGQIDLSSGKHTYSFTFTNNNDKPVVVHTVISSCGCTAPEWTRSPVMPGKSGKITVTFLNDQGPYPFDKVLTVYISAVHKPILLRVKGVVTQKPKPLKVLYPEKYSVIGFRKRVEDFGTISQGAVTRGSIDVANLSSQPASLSFTNISEGLHIASIQDKIAAGQKGEILFEVDTRSSDKWGVTRYSATPVVNGTSTGKEIVIEAIIREDFSKMSKEEIDSSPLPMADRSTHNFGAVRSGEVVKASFDIKNLGKKDLSIRKADISDGSLKVDFPSVISPMKSGKVNVSVNTSGQNGTKLYMITLITNSPSRPIINLIVSGEIKK